MFLVVFGSILAGALYWLSHSGYRHPEGKQVAPETPKQKALSGKKKKKWSKEGYLIEAQATFEITGRVLFTDTFRTGRESDLSPIDLTFAWGKASDTAVLKLFDFSKDGRFYRYEWDSPEADGNMMRENSANMHMIPKDSLVAADLKRVSREDVVTVTGYLVNVSAPDGWHWESSLTRSDDGAGACELIWVESIKIK